MYSLACCHDRSVLEAFKLSNDMPRCTRRLAETVWRFSVPEGVDIYPVEMQLRICHEDEATRS